MKQDCVKWILVSDLVPEVQSFFWTIQSVKVVELRGSFEKLHEAEEQNAASQNLWTSISTKRASVWILRCWRMFFLLRLQSVIPGSQRESEPAQAGSLNSKLDFVFCFLHLNPAAITPSLNWEDTPRGQAPSVNCFLDHKDKCDCESLMWLNNTHFRIDVERLMFNFLW